MRVKSTLLIAALIWAFSCDSPNSREGNFKNAQNLFVEFVSAYTDGYISSQSEIKVKLAKSVSSAEPGKEISADLFQFEPQIKGSAYWEDNRTAVFKPSGRLVSGQEYKATFLLNQVLETTPDKSEFKFIFHCIPQNYEVDIEGVTLYDAQNLERVKIIGYIQTADVVSPDQSEKMIKAEQNGQELEINFEHGVAQNRHQFTIENIVRAEDEEEVEISWNGDPIGVDKEESVDYEIPSLSDYKVTSTSIIRAGENYISVSFSDPIDDKQNLRGIVRLSQGTNPRIVVDLNELKIYPTSRLAGTVTLNIDKSIKNTAGYTLKSDYQAPLRFSQLKPEVKIVANQGVIMPNSQGLIVPFEAVSLRAVDLAIVEIFENNVLQYLQTNRPGDQSQIRQVGRPVVRRTIPLNALGTKDLNDWNRFTIDLADFVEVNPGAFYQIRLNFRKSHSLYFCERSEEDDLSGIEEEWEYQEETNWDAYDDYYNYDWENRDNPCHEAYYTRSRLVTKIVFGSNIGLIAKKADQGGLTVFATDLLTTKPLTGVDLEAYDYQQQKIGSGKTDVDGKAQLVSVGKPFTIIARQDGQFGYLKVHDGSSLSLSNFNVTGSKIQKGIKGFLYGERGVWRPGDTLHLSFMLEDVQDRLPENHPVIMELFNPLGQLQTRTVQSASLKDLYTFKPVTPKDAPTGNWLAKVKVGGASFSKQLKVETVKPNRLKIDLKFENERLFVNQTSFADLNVRWLHGATARNLRASYEVLMVPTKTVFKGYENLTFDDPSKEFYPEPESIFEGRLNEQGYSRVGVSLSPGESPPGMMNAIFRGKVFEEGGDFSIDKTTVPFVPYESFVGILLPEGDRRGMLTTDEDHAVRIVTLNGEGKPVSRSNLQVELYKLRWRWWWDNSYENSSNFTSRYSSERVKSGTVYTRNGEGTYRLRLDHPEWGRFFLKVTDPQSGHSSGKVVYIDWPGWAGKQRGELGGATMLSFDVQKAKVDVGEKIRINVPSSEGGRILVSLESGSKILQTFWVSTKSESTPIEFEATADMAPNVYVHLSMLQPHAQTLNDLPVRMYGVESIEVSDPETVLEPVIKMPEELGPGQNFKVTIAEANRKPMAYTVAIVEDGLLDLTKFSTPEPHKSFYAREALGVKTWDVFDHVVGAYGGRIERLLALGGDGEVDGPEENEANRFKPVILFKGPYYLPPGEEQTLDFTMPQYIGSVRAMVVAGYEGTYGNEEKSVPVKQPLMILATLPRVVGPSEDITLPVNVFTMDDKIKSVNVKVESNDGLQLEGPSEQTLAFERAGDQLRFFRLKAAPTLGVGKLKVTATSGNLEATYDVELQIRPSNPEMNQVEEKLLAGGEQWALTYKPLGIGGTNEGSIEISSLPPLNLEKRLRYLIRYPHGCIEQTTSSVFAQLYLDDLMDLDEDRATKIQKNINAAIERLRSFQLPSGAFAYWPGQSEPNYWGTNYAGHFLLEARSQGYLVPEDMISHWVTFQLEEANQWTSNRYNDYLIQAYRLYGLALSNNPALGAMNRLKEDQSVSERAKWSLASAYATSGYEQAALEIIDGLSREVKEYRELGNTYGSNLRDEAMILETLVRLGRQEDAFQLIRKISQYFGDKNRWLSTQTSAYCLIGIAEFAKKFPPETGINTGVVISGNEFRLDGTKYLNQLTLIEPDRTAELKITNNGANPLFVRIIRSGVPLEGEEVAKQSNIKLTVAYHDLNGNAVNVANLPQGTDFMASITVTNPGLRGDYEELAVTQIFPSGWEIQNTRLDDVDQFYQGDNPEYQDIRDDRVMTYFDLKRNESATFNLLLNSSYQGTFYLPAVSVEAMYDNSIAANTEGRWVTIQSTQ